MNKFKKLSFLSLVVAGVVCLASGCGSSSSTIDWSSMNYYDYYTLYANETAPEGTEGYWDYWETKTVAYQFVTTTHNDNHNFAAYFPMLLNLYEDGSVKGWQRCILTTMFNMLEGQTEEETEFYSASGCKVIELFFGYWEKDDSTNEITLYVQNSFDYSVDGDSIQYKSYTIDLTPDEDGIISFFFHTTEKGQLISSYMTCDTTYEGNVKYSSILNYANGITVDAETE